jgi:hypothetical protein
MPVLEQQVKDLLSIGGRNKKQHQRQEMNGSNADPVPTNVCLVLKIPSSGRVAGAATAVAERLQSRGQSEWVVASNATYLRA